jgi:hypothetical protein
LPAAVRFWTDIPSASIKLDGEDRGAAVPGEMLELAGLGAGEHVLAISSPDGNAELRFQTAPALPPEYVAPQVPRGLRLLLMSVMGGAGRLHASSPVKVSWDGTTFVDVGPDGIELADLQPGTRELTIDQGSGSPRKAVVMLGEGPVLNAFVLSGRALDFGSLLVRSNEPDVTILVNGRPRRPAKTEQGLIVSSIAVGRHKLGVRKQGYHSSLQEGAVEVQAGKTAEVDVTLTPVQPLLAVTGAVRETQVRLDGNLVGTTRGGELRVEVPLGAHNIELARRGYHARTLKFVFQLGTEHPVKPPESVLRRMLGTFIFSVKPERNVTLKIEPHTDVFEYDRTVLKEVPPKLELPPGHYNMTFSSPGYQDKIVSPEIVDGEDKPIGIVLDRR